MKRIWNTKPRILTVALATMVLAASVASAAPFSAARYFSAAMCNHDGMDEWGLADLLNRSGSEKMVQCGLSLEHNVNTIDNVYIWVNDYDDGFSCTLVTGDGSVYTPNSVQYNDDGQWDKVKWTTNRNVGSSAWAIRCAVPDDGSVRNYYIDQD